MGIDKYTQMLQALLPRGPAWPRDKNAVLTKLLSGLAKEFSRVIQRGEDLLRESDPAEAAELLPEWEKTYGLPDVCLGELATLQDRRNALYARMTQIGDQSLVFFQELAEELGFNITITETKPFRAGHSAAGEALYNDAWAYTWIVHAPGIAQTWFRAGQSTANEPIRTWGKEQVLECFFRTFNPAHLELIFCYEEENKYA